MKDTHCPLKARRVEAVGEHSMKRWFHLPPESWTVNWKIKISKEEGYQRWTRK